MKSKTKTFTYVIMVLFLMIASIFFKSFNIDKELIQTSGSLERSNTKIEYATKRENNHKKPDLRIKKY